MPRTVALTLTQARKSGYRKERLQVWWALASRTVWTPATRMVASRQHGGGDSVPKSCVMRAHELSRPSLGTDNTATLNYSLNTHAGDQTGSRLRPPHCGFARRSHYTLTNFLFRRPAGPKRQGSLSPICDSPWMAGGFPTRYSKLTVFSLAAYAAASHTLQAARYPARAC